MRSGGFDLVLLSAAKDEILPSPRLGKLRRFSRLEDCLALRQSEQPHAVLLGASLADSPLTHAVHRLNETLPDVTLVVWADLDNEKQALSLVQAGATDYVLHDVMDDDTLASRIEYAIQRHTARALFEQAFNLKGCKSERPWDWAFELGADCKFRWLSKNFLGRQHLLPSLMLGRTPWEVDEVEHDPDRWRQYLRDFDDRKPFVSLACRLRDQDGNRRAFRMWGEPVFSPDGVFLGYAGTGVDISQEVENTTRLSDAYELLKDMFDDLQGYRERLEEDLEAARSSQRGLLPKPETVSAIEEQSRVVLTHYFEPTSELGGDIWGCIPLKGGQFALYLADFSGHGVAAALNTFRLTTLIQEHHEKRDEPAAYLEILNGRLKESLPTGQYATMLYGVVDPKAGRFRYAAAAAPRPLVVNLQNAAIEPGEGRGLPLGAVGGAKFMERDLSISPGSLIVLASDALAESVDADGKALGKDGVAELVRRVAMDKVLEANAKTILEPFFKFVQRPLKDDLTVVTCQILKG
jgi:serine phosphatase RsbU (regulator of sigma subunit)/PAS domain-containing protein